MKCSKCDTVFPNKDYPQDNTFMVSSRFGWITHIPRMTNPDMPYQENGAGKGLAGIDSLTSHYWYLKHFELKKSVGALLDAYVRTQDEKYMEPLMALCLGTVDLIEKGTVNRPNRYRRWDCTMLGGIVPGVKMQGPHPLDFSPSYGHWVISIFGPVYDATYDNPMWDKVVPKYGVKARYVFEDKVLSVTLRSALMVNERHWAHIAGNLGTPCGAFLNMAKLTGDARHAHFSFNMMFSHFEEYGPCGYDYCLMDRSGNYEDFQTGYAALVKTFYGYKDGEGYVNDIPRYFYLYGKRIDSTFPHDYPSVLRAIRGRTGTKAAYYNGPAFHDKGGGSHNGRPHLLYNPSCWWRAMFGQMRPSLRVRNRMLPCAGVSVLAEGYEGLGSEESLEGQRSATGLNSWTFGNHFGVNRLRLHYSANGKKIFPHDASFGGKNDNRRGSVPYLGGEQSGSSIHVKDSAHTPKIAYALEMPGMAMITHDASQSYSMAEVARRTVVHNTIDKKSPYVIDVIHLKGAMEDLTHHGTLLHTRVTDSKIGNGLSLKPVSHCRFDKRQKKMSEVSTAEAIKRGGMQAMLNNTTGTKIEKDTFMDFTFTDDIGGSLRAHIIFENDGLSKRTREIFLGQRFASGVKAGSGDYGENTMIYEETFNGQTGKQQSVMLFVYEPYVKGQFERQIESIKRESLNKGKALGITVTRKDGRVDTYTLSLELDEQKMKHNGLETDGYFAASAKKGEKSDLWLYRGQYAKNDLREVTQAAGTVEAKILETVKDVDNMGKGDDSFLIDAPLAEGEVLKDDWLSVYFYDEENGSLKDVHSYRIKRIEKEGENTRVVIDNDTQGLGFRLMGSHIKAVPGVASQQGVTQNYKIKMFHQKTTVPRVRIANSRKPFYYTEEAWGNSFEARDTDTYEIPYYSSLPGQSIRYTLDGSKPTPQSAVLKAGTTATGDRTIKARIFNEKGLLDSPLLSWNFKMPVKGQASIAGGKPGVAYISRPSLPAGVKHGGQYDKDGGVIQASQLNLLDENPTNRRRFTQFDAYLKIEKDGYYTFSISHPGLMFIGETRVIDNDFQVGTLTGEIALRAGWHPVRFYHTHLKERKPPAFKFLVNWKGPDFDWRDIKDDEMVYTAEQAQAPYEDYKMAHYFYMPDGKTLITDTPVRYISEARRNENEQLDAVRKAVEAERAKKSKGKKGKKKSKGEGQKK
jgi:hypothetical protein